MGGGRVGGVRVDVNEELKFFFWGGRGSRVGGGGGVREVGLGGQGRCERRSEVFEKIQKKTRMMFIKH